MELFYFFCFHILPTVLHVLLNFAFFHFLQCTAARLVPGLLFDLESRQSVTDKNRVGAKMRCAANEACFPNIQFFLNRDRENEALQ